jgi:hypothetical protein
MRTHSPRQFAARLATVGAALVLATGTLVGTQVAGASSAQAVTGIQKITGKVSATDSQPSKTAPPALCPSGQRVIGGGGWVFTTATGANTVGLTELRPVHPASGQDSYVVSAQELTPNVTTTWSVQAYAICANPVSDLTIVSKESSAFNQVNVLCPSNHKVLGSGGQVNNPANHVALNFVSPFETGGNVWVAASDFVTGGSSVWTVTAFAVCAPAPPGYQVVFAPSSENLSEPVKVAFVTCPAGTRVHGAAAGVVPERIAGSTQGLVLQVVYPFNALDRVEASAVETITNNTSWDVRAVAICAT